MCLNMVYPLLDVASCTWKIMSFRWIRFSDQPPAADEVARRWDPYNIGMMIQIDEDVFGMVCLTSRSHKKYVCIYNYIYIHIHVCVCVLHYIVYNIVLTCKCIYCVYVYIYIYMYTWVATKTLKTYIGRLKLWGPFGSAISTKCSFS